MKRPNPSQQNWHNGARRRLLAQKKRRAALEAAKVSTAAGIRASAPPRDNSLVAGGVTESSSSVLTAVPLILPVGAKALFSALNFPPGGVAASTVDASPTTIMLLLSSGLGVHATDTGAIDTKLDDDSMSLISSIDWLQDDSPSFPIVMGRNH